MSRLKRLEQMQDADRRSAQGATAPVAELVLGARFAAKDWTSAVHGVFWKELGEEWPETYDAPRLPPIPLLTDRLSASEGLFSVFREPHSGRLMIVNRRSNRMMQVQSDQFLFNWRRHEEEYPSYRCLIAEFIDHFKRLLEISESLGIQSPRIEGWQLTYVDSFPQGEFWSRREEQWSLFPSMLGDPSILDGNVASCRGVRVGWDCVLADGGALHVSLFPGKTVGDERESLLMETVVRGAVAEPSLESLKAGMDAGHAAAVHVFGRIIPRSLAESLGVG